MFWHEGLCLFVKIFKKQDVNKDVFNWIILSATRLPATSERPEWHSFEIPLLCSLYSTQTVSVSWTTHHRLTDLYKTGSINTALWVIWSPSGRRTNRITSARAEKKNFSAETVVGFRFFIFIPPSIQLGRMESIPVVIEIGYHDENSWIQWVALHAMEFLSQTTGGTNRCRF